MIIRKIVIMLFVSSILLMPLTLHKTTLEKLTTSSHLIVRGNVESSYSVWEGDNIFTYSKVQVTTNLKGKYLSKYITVKQYGGTVGEISAEVDGAPTLENRDDVILFLVSWKNNYWIHSIALGCYKVFKSGTETYAVNNLHNFEFIDPGTRKPVNDEKALQSQYKLGEMYNKIKTAIKNGETR